MTVVSAIWYFTAATMAGKFGKRLQRRLKYLNFDSANTDFLLNVLERYKAGEFTVQRSHYHDSLIFAKVITNPSNGIEYHEQQFYVSVDDPDEMTFGWISDESKSSKIILNEMYKGIHGINRSAVSNEAYFELINIHSELLKNWGEEPRYSDLQKKPKNKKEVILS